MTSITPLELPPSATGVLLFGGMFDPPHIAHVEIPAKARDEIMPGAWLVYVPAARSPHKPGGPAAPDAHRIAMLQLATSAVRQCAIWTDEIDRAKEGEPSYWVITLERARKAIPESLELRFLIGSDQAVAFHRWRDAHRILELASPIVMLRAPHNSAGDLLAEMAESGQWTTAELEAWRTRIYDGVRLRAASTDVRQHAKGSRDLIDPRVEAYIKRNALYR